MKYDVIVIGGGAAGMSAAVSASSENAKVLLVEKNEKLGKKLYITGKGRCNVTNTAGRDEFFRNIMRNPRFFYAAYSNFDNNALMAMIEENGTKLKTERGGRVFPVSDKASDITRAFGNALNKNNVEVSFNTCVERLLYNDDVIKGIQTQNGREIGAKAVIIATGGLSYASTGSTGDGLRFAAKTNHTVTECLPSLVPINTQETWPFSLSGLTLKNVKLSASVGKKTIFSEMGEMLFTHFGISGPLVLSCSSVLPADPAGVELMIDLKPALTIDMLDERIIRDIRSQPRASVSSVFYGLMPRSLAQELVKAFGFDGEKKAGEWKAAERRAAVDLIKGIPLTVRSLRGFNEAIITRGGVSTKDVDPSTMSSKKIKGLYFAGEVLDIDALTGGFNLQIAFSTGRLAGMKAAEYAIEG